MHNAILFHHNLSPIPSRSFCLLNSGHRTGGLVLYKFTVGLLHAQIGQCGRSALRSREGEAGGGKIEKTNRRRGGPENEEVKGEIKVRRGVEMAF